MTVAYTDWVASVQCGQKRRWGTSGEAQRRAAESAAAYDEPPSSWGWYRCPHCRYYHIGHVRRTS